MIWRSAADFFAMGGYGVYVWGSFGLAAVAFVIEFVLVRHRRRTAVASLRRQVIAARLEEESA